jgi:tetratricopeptide (TPR) repeat protein
MLFGLYEEAFKVANRIDAKRLSDPTKRAITVDRLDAAGELGQDVDQEWLAVLEKAARLGPAVYGQVLQRRAVFLCRRGRTTDSYETFLDAAKYWGEVDGAEEQVSEALFSAELADAINGNLVFDRDLGTRQVAALARGPGNVPAARAERLLLIGLGALANGDTPEAIKHLTMAARVERRAGDLFGLRRTLAMLGRAYDAAQEPEQALRWWVQAGLETQASAAAQLIETSDALRAVLRLDSDAPWERATSLAAMVAVADRLTSDEVEVLGAQIVAEAHDPPSLVAPQPSYHARQLLVAVADRLPQDQFAAAITILEEELELDGYSARKAPEALLVLNKRGAGNGLQPVAEAILAGQDVTVTIAAWLREAPKKTQLRFVERARSGDVRVLAETCRADLPKRFPELVELCEQQVVQAIQTHKTSATEYVGFSFTDLGEFGRFCSKPTQSELTDLLGDVLKSASYDTISKTTAMIATALLAPTLDQPTASSLLRRVLPTASGNIPDSAPAVLHSHPNPERSRNRLNRSVPDSQLRAAAIQAAGRLAQIAAPASTGVRDMLDTALTSPEPELQRTALHELCQLPGICPCTPLEPLLDSDDPAIAAAAQSLLALGSSPDRVPDPV